jgi:putative PEP-CTERM system TPR-repeat lipoprotein
MDAPSSRFTRLALLTALSLSAAIPLAGCDRIIGVSAEEHIQRAKDMQAEGDLKGGILELKNAIQKAPDSTQARFLLGNLYVSARQGSAAEKELTKARELGLDEEMIKVPLGEALLLTRDYKRLLEEVRPSEKTSSTNRAKILSLHGNAKLGLREWQQACELFGQALTVDKTHAAAHWGLAKCAVIESKPEDARAHLGSVIRQNPNNADAWIMLGEFERYSRNLQAAVKAYNAALKLAPNDILALAERANTYIFLGQPELAGADIKRLKEIAPRHYMVDYLQALQNSRAGKTDEALSAVQKALQGNPDYPPAVYLLGALQYRRGANEQAARVLNQYLRMLPGDQAARTLLARIHLALNQPDQSLALLQPLLVATPSDATLLSLASQAQLQQRNPAAATATLQKAVALNPGDAALHSQFGLAKLGTGDVDSAMAELNTASQLDKKRLEPLVALTLLHMQRKEYDLALDTLKQLQAAVPDSPVVYNLFGAVYLKQRNDAEARRQFEHALELNPTYMAAVMNLAQMDVRDGKPQAAEARYRQVLEKDKDNLLALQALADLARDRKDEAAFLDLLGRAVRAHPSAPQARLALAQHYLEKGDKQKALSEARQALTANPDNLDALDTMGRIQLAMGDPGSARSNYARLAELAPKSALAQYKYALAQLALNDERGARASLQRALQLEPVFHDAQAALGRLALKQKRLDEALGIARQMQQQHPALPTGFALEGDCLMASRQYQAATQRYEQAYRIAPGGPLAVKLHAAYAAAGQPAVGEARLLQWLRQSPGDNAARLFLASAYAWAGQHKAAIAQYELVARTEPNNPLILNNLAWQLFLDGDARALGYAERAYKLAPANPAVMDTLGWLLVQKNQTARGLGLLQKAAAQAPQTAEIRYHLAAALARNGQKAQAKQELATLLRSGKDFPQRKEAQALHDRL